MKYKNYFQLIDIIDKINIYLYFIQSGNAIDTQKFFNLCITRTGKFFEKTWFLSVKSFPNGIWEREIIHESQPVWKLKTKK